MRGDGPFVYVAENGEFFLKKVDGAEETFSGAMVNFELL
jgi:hypothetical protein